VQAVSGAGSEVILESDEPASKVHANYQGNFDRLLALKNQYDPGNLFRLNANIVPTARG
jgi:hypothetical protein